MLKVKTALLIFFSVCLLAPNFINYNIIEDNSKTEIHEKFDPSLVRLNTMDKLEAYIDSIALTKHIKPESPEYAIEAKNIITYRFYHKYATQNLNENWIASFAQKFTGLYLSSKIKADDILTRSYGYCGQQNTVLMKLLKRKNHDYRVLYLPHHFVIQSKINGKWYFFDADQEPDISTEQRVNEEWLYNRDSLAISYKKDTGWINYIFGNPVDIKYGKINEIQGPRARVFQAITKVLSRIAFLFPLLLIIYLNKKKKIAARNSKQVASCGHNHFYNNECAGQRV